MSPAPSSCGREGGERTIGASISGDAASRTSVGEDGAVSTYDFEFEGKYAPMLRLIGVSPARAWVKIDDEEVTARFGLARFRTRLDNIADACISGPYMGIKAIGIRLSFVDSGITFGSTTAGGVCLLLKEPVAVIDPTGHRKHAGITLTVADREGFAAEVRQAAGLPPKE